MLPSSAIVPLLLVTNTLFLSAAFSDEVSGKQINPPFPVPYFSRHSRSPEESQPHCGYLYSYSSGISMDAVVSHPSKLVLLPGRPVDESPGARPGAVLLCNRVIVRGFSRLHKASKYANALKVTVFVDPVDALFRIQTTEICFHKYLPKP